MRVKRRASNRISAPSASRPAPWTSADCPIVSARLRTVRACAIGVMPRSTSNAPSRPRTRTPSSSLHPPSPSARSSIRIGSPIDRLSRSDSLHRDTPSRHSESPRAPVSVAGEPTDRPRGLSIFWEIPPRRRVLDVGHNPPPRSDAGVGEGAFRALALAPLATERPGFCWGKSLSRHCARAQRYRATLPHHPVGNPLSIVGPV
jgi:hypothetical protein